MACQKDEVSPISPIPLKNHKKLKDFHVEKATVAQRSARQGDLTMMLKTYDTTFLDFLRRWEPSLRMTPDQALKHAWIHEPQNLSPQPRPQTPRKPSLCFPSETSKSKGQGHLQLGKKEIKDGSTEQVRSSGHQQGSFQHTPEVQLPHLVEASRKQEAVVGPEESKTSTGQENKSSSPKNTNILPPISGTACRTRLRCILFPWQQLRAERAVERKESGSAGSEHPRAGWQGPAKARTKSNAHSLFPEKTKH
ncbi:hypothetical protein MC885_011086 [Smutsia gigantea]|nr:hypothetical protein MC885_011086 [Smutsia gigantea]